MSPKNNSDLNQMSQSKPAVAPASKGVDRGSYTRGGGPMPKPKSGGFLSGLKSALTKKPTARGPSEYEQIMTDIQPSRKKKR
jgi:hypothetical protein